MRVVAALGGNALLRRGEPLDIATQRANARVAARALAAVARDHELVVTHGNGPQVGLLALQAAADPSAPATPLDVLGAESDGMIGYVLAQELRNAMPDREVAMVLTQVVVDQTDPAFSRPTKPIGPVYADRAEAEARAEASGWTIAPDGASWRRVVASPEPQEIVELPAIEALLQHGIVPICTGGGGVPVVRDADGLRGVEAVVDKDLSAALLAQALDADALLLLTDVDGVYRDWGAPGARRLSEIDAADMAGLGLPAGSMEPKTVGAARFAEATGALAAIGALADAAGMLAGAAGTRVVARQPTGEASV